MADEAPSSPLSSPPRSVINVQIYSPAKEETQMPPSAPSSPRPEPITEKAEEPAHQPKVEASESVEAGKVDTNSPDDNGQSSSQKRKASITRKPVPAKKPRRILVSGKKSAQDRKWEAPFVYTDAKSPLANADLRAILLHPEAWDILTQEEKENILAKFPDATHILAAGTPNARPDTVSLRNDDNFRHDCARYCENIELGQHDEEWLNQAWVAHEKHKRGDYDEFLREQFEEEWNTKLPDDTKVQEPVSNPASRTELAGSKQGATEPAASPALGAQEALALEPIPGQSSQSPEHAVGSSPTRMLQNGEGTTDKAASPVGSSNPEPPSTDPTNPSTTSQQQSEVALTSALPSD